MKLQYLSALVLVACVCALPLSFAAEEKPATPFDECAKACNDCQRACDACSTHCARLMADGKKEHMSTLQTCQDCATHCSAAASIVSRQGPFSDVICTACAE